MDSLDGSPSLNRELSLSFTNHLRSTFLKNEEHTPNGKGARAAYMKTFGMASVNSSSDVVAVSYESVGLLSRPRLTAIRFERPKHLTYKAGAQQFTDLLVVSIGNDQPPLRDQVAALIMRPRQAYHTTLPQTCFQVLSAIQQTATDESDIDLALFASEPLSRPGTSGSLPQVFQHLFAEDAIALLRLKVFLLKFWLGHLQSPSLQLQTVVSNRSSLLTEGVLARLHFFVAKAETIEELSSGASDISG
jgi:hypothetical protein